MRTSATITSTAPLSVTIIMLATAVMAIVIAGTGNPAMMAIAWDTLSMFFFRHLRETGDGSVEEEEEKEEGRGPRQGGALALLGQFLLGGLLSACTAPAPTATNAFSSDRDGNAEI